VEVPGGDLGEGLVAVVHGSAPLVGERMNASIGARSQWNVALPREIEFLTANADRHAGHE
jgi:hypothetical protein